MTSMYLAVTHTPLENKLYMLLVRFPHSNMKCESSIFPSKRSKVLEQGYVTKKKNYFPNVNFKLIFKLHKASLSANRKDFQRRRD